MNYDYLDSLKQLPKSEIDYINKELKDNCINHDYDLIVMDHSKFIYAYIIKDADIIEKKIKPLAGLETTEIAEHTRQFMMLMVIILPI